MQLTNSYEHKTRSEVVIFRGRYRHDRTSQPCIHKLWDPHSKGMNRSWTWPLINTGDCHSQIRARKIRLFAISKIYAQERTQWSTCLFQPLAASLSARTHVHTEAHTHAHTHIHTTKPTYTLARARAHTHIQTQAQVKAHTKAGTKVVKFGGCHQRWHTLFLSVIKKIISLGGCLPGRSRGIGHKHPEENFHVQHNLLQRYNSECECSSINCRAVFVPKKMDPIIQHARGPNLSRTCTRISKLSSTGGKEPRKEPRMWMYNDIFFASIWADLMSGGDNKTPLSQESSQ
jgi:hypothetical protein